MQQIFKRTGIEVTAQNKKKIDEAIHRIVRVRYKNCPATWREVKKIAEDEDTFVSELKKALVKHQ